MPYIIIHLPLSATDEERALREFWSTLQEFNYRVGAFDIASERGYRERLLVISLNLFSTDDTYNFPLWIAH